jgi:hypothetical protein
VHSGHEVLKVGFVDDDFAVVHVLQDVVEGDMTALFFEGLILVTVGRHTFVMF